MRCFTVPWAFVKEWMRFIIKATNYAVVHQNSLGDKYISIQFPALVMDLNQHSINNKFGDAAFSLIVFDPK